MSEVKNDTQVQENNVDLTNQPENNEVKSEEVLGNTLKTIYKEGGNFENLENKVFPNKESNKESLDKSEKKNEKELKGEKVKRELFETASNYLDTSLGEGLFSPEEKDNIKFVLLGEIVDDLDIGNSLTSMLESILESLKNLQLALTVENKTETSSNETARNLKKASEGFSEIFSKFGLEGRMEEINAKIEKLKAEKQKDKNKEFDKLGDVLGVVNPEKLKGKSEQEIFNNITNSTNTALTKIGQAAEMGEGAKDAFNSLPQSFREGIRSLLNMLVGALPFLKNIFDKFLGKEVLDGSSDKEIESINSLKDYINDKDFPFKDKIKFDESNNPEDAFEPSQLKDFYSLLKTKEYENIDYTTEDFWKELFTGKPGEGNKQNDNIQELHNLLKGEGNSILDGKDDISDLIDKLNGLERKNLKSLISQVENIKSIPTNIEYKGTKIRLAIENNNIILGDSKFAISIIALGMEKFEKIEFIEGQRGGFVLNGKKEKPLSKEEIAKLIKNLMENNSYSFKGEEGLISYRGEITKLS